MPCARTESVDVTSPLTGSVSEGLLGMFQVVVVECDVEPWVLLDGNGSGIYIPHSHRRGTGRKRPTESRKISALAWWGVSATRAGKGLTLQ